MDPVDPSIDARSRLADALAPLLESHPTANPHDAERLACLLIGRERFTQIVGERPGGAIASLPPPFDGLSLPGSTRAILADWRGQDGADKSPPTSIDAGYEAALGSEVRGDHGQFFTPTPIADALVGWALDGAATDASPPRILDPAVGTGTFLLASARQIQTRWAASDPASYLDCFVGVDVDAVALQLAGLRLAAMAAIPAPDELALHHASFFDCVPVSRTSVDAAVELGPVDAVVGNPPFIRAEDLQPDADHFRRHLAAFGPPGETPFLEGPEALSRRSDAYVYFVTHATRFLRPGGRLALILPTKWLMSDYGKDLRRFLYDRYHVHAIVGIERGPFEDALIDTVLLLAERTDACRSKKPIRFVQLDGPIESDTLQSVIADESAPTGAIRMASRPQDALRASRSLAPYLEVPPALLEAFESAPFVRLDALADVSRGTMTGANRFFFVDDDTVERFELEAPFLNPAVKSLRSVERPTVTHGDVDRYLLDIHPFITDLRELPAEEPTPFVKTALSTAGHDGILAYIEHAEMAEWHQGPTCQSRPVWFDLGPLHPPVAFVPKLLRERVFVVRNDARAVPSNAIDAIWPADGVDPGALLAVLNASVGKAAMEVTGRDEAGLLQLMTYETASLPTLDVSGLSDAKARSLAQAGEDYATDPGQRTLAALDEAIEAGFDLPLAPGTFGRHARELRRQRTGDRMASKKSE